MQKRIGKRFVLAMVLAAAVPWLTSPPVHAVWCEIVSAPDNLRCVFCHRWIRIDAETCDLWEGWCSDGWYDNGWFCWGNL